MRSLRFDTPNRNYSTPTLKTEYRLPIERDPKPIKDIALIFPQGGGIAFQACKDVPAVRGAEAT